MPRYALGLVLIALVKVAREYHRETLRSASLSIEYANTRIAMLSAQLQPHFLFNALHTIAELVDQNPARATTMLARLGDFLRHALETSKQRWVSVLTEISGIEAYLAVQQARFGDRLQVHIAVDAAAAFHGDYEVVLKRATRLTLSRRFRSRMSPFFAGAWPA